MMKSTARPAALLLLIARAALVGGGDMLLTLTLQSHVYAATGAGLAVSALVAARVGPVLLLSPVAGAVADRLDRRAVALACGLVQAVALLVIAGQTGPGALWVIYAALVAEAVAQAFLAPALEALLPQVVARDELTAANGRMMAAQTAAGIVVAAVGGALLQRASLTTAVLVAAAAYGLGSLLLAGLPGAPPEGRAPRGAGGGRPMGVRELAAMPWLPALAALLAGIMLAQGAINVVMVAYVGERLGGGPQLLGWVVVAQGLGASLGALAVRRLEAWAGPGRALAGCAAVAAGCWLVAGAGPGLPALLALSAVAGAAIIGLVILPTALIQRAAPPAYRGRLLGAAATLAALASLAGAQAAGLAVDRLGLVPACLGLALAYGAVGLIAAAGRLRP